MLMVVASDEQERLFSSSKSRVTKPDFTFSGCDATNSPEVHPVWSIMVHHYLWLS
jgi:hypothetical protein